MTFDFKFAIFDIDGTLTEIKPGVLAKAPRMVTPNQLGEQQAMAGVPEKLAELSQAGIEIALATNRGGVAFGYNTLPEAQQMAEEAAVLCGIAGVAVYVCPYHAKARGKRAHLEFAKEHECRKPRPGMLLEAMKDANIPPEDTIFVGDFDTDRQAAENAGVRFIWAADFFA